MQPTTLLVLLCYLSLTKAIKLTILHNFGINGCFDEITNTGGYCRDPHKCIAGVARMAHIVRKMRRENPEVIFFNSGNNLIGTVWTWLYNSTIAAEMLNYLEPDAGCLGNHDFDLGVPEAVNYIKLAKFPILGTNVQISDKLLKGAKLHKSVILKRYGIKIGVVAYLTPQTLTISYSDGISITDEIRALNAECKSLKRQGAQIILALGHSPRNKNNEIAAKVKSIDAIIGGHAVVLLWNGRRKPDIEKIDGPYPEVIIQESGKTVPIVYAYNFGKYMGMLHLTFNKKFKLFKYTGNPMLLANSVPQEEDVMKYINTYRPHVKKVYNQRVGTSAVFLDGSVHTCRYEECNMGNIVAESMVYSRMISHRGKEWTDAPIAFYNSRFIRNSLAKGPLYRGDIITVIPYSQKLMLINITGSQLRQTIELAVRDDGRETNRGEFLQVAGLRYVVELNNETMNRVSDIKVRCSKCWIPHYQKLYPKSYYTVITSSFLANGGDGFTSLKNCKNKQVMPFTDTDALELYVKNSGILYAQLDKRIAIKSNNCAVTSGSVTISLAAVILLLSF